MRSEWAIPVTGFHMGMGSHVSLSFEDRGVLYMVDARRYKLHGEVVRVWRRDIEKPPAYMWLGRGAESL
jgi:hypothetical protein